MIPKSHHPELSDTKPSSFTAAFQSLFSLQNPRLWILLAFLFLQTLLVFNLYRFPSSILHPTQNAVVQHQSTLPQNDYVEDDDDQCVFGRVFVYDLPTLLNKEIIENCDDHNPWSFRCDALANDGYGQRATELAGIVPEDLLPAWYWTGQFVSEIIFHKRMLRHKCRATEPQSATAFYIPFYAGLDVVNYFWADCTAQERDRHCDMMLTWLNDQPYYKRSNGSDHFITLGRISSDFRRTQDKDWGSSCIYKPGMTNVTRLIIERNTTDYFDVGVPYPTGFHPRSHSDVTRWQAFVRDRKRTSLFSFVAAPRSFFKKDFRKVLQGQCRDSGELCRAVNCAGKRCLNGTSALLESFLDSEFCLQPRGDSYTRKSVFDCMVAGSIPVFFWRRTAYLQYEWFLPGEQGSYSVYIDRNVVRNGTSVKAVLESYGKEEVRKMREKVIEYIPRLIYATKGLEGIKDAFDLALEGVLRRVRDKKYWEFQ